MKRYLFLIALLIAWSGRVVAQSVTVDATIDSLQILIGEQAKIKLQVSLDADKRAIFPVYTDTLVNGVEIIDVAKPDTQLLNDGRRALITQEYTVTSFDSALYYLPPMEVTVDNEKYRSKALALKVYSVNVPLDPENPEQFFGPKSAVWNNSRKSDRASLSFISSNLSMISVEVISKALKPKRSLRTKILLGAGIVVLAVALVSSLIYIGLELYNYFA